MDNVDYSPILHVDSRGPLHVVLRGMIIMGTFNTLEEAHELYNDISIGEMR